MEDNNMELLKKIKRIDAPDHIYDQIVKHIEDRKIQIIPMYKIAVAVCLLLVLIASETIIGTKLNKVSQSSGNLEQLFMQMDNNLYNE